MKKTPISRFEIRLSGFGGQGLITLGRLMGAAFALGHGYNVTQTQSYGPEARGGSSRADLVVSSSPISYPKTEQLDLLVALSQEACNNYFPYLKRTGILLIDTTLVRQPPTNVFLGLPFTEMAQEKIGNPMTLNTIVMGAISHILPFADPRTMRTSLEENMPEKLVPINVKAFTLGHKKAKKYFGSAEELWELAEANGINEEDSEHD